MEDQIKNNSKIINFDPDSSSPTIIYKSKVMTGVLELLEKASRTENTTVLITGESGTGKELVARAIHYKSKRCNNPLIAVNCASIPETLIESELFGHEKGSFTGAGERKKGKFELAQGGTLFLDEVGELSPSAQVKLLRVIQEREFERIGGSESISVDVRLITATNRNLEQDMKDGKFREDLYYRIKVIPIRLPALRERMEDIPLLIEFFMNAYNMKESCSISIQNDVIDTFARSQYPWPGNIRELQYNIERMMAMGNGITINSDDIPPEIISGNNGLIETEPVFNRDARSYRKLVEWVLKEQNYLKGKQCEEQLKTKAKQLNVWPTKQGIAGIGRSLIKVLDTHKELFQDIDREGIKNIFDLLFLLAPSFKMEKDKSVKNLLNNWSEEKIKSSPLLESMSVDCKIQEKSISRSDALDKEKDSLFASQITSQNKKSTKKGLSEEDIGVLIEFVFVAFILIYLCLIFYSPDTWLIPIIHRFNRLMEILTNPFGY